MAQFTITINADFNNREDLIDTLNRIANELEQGFLQGYNSNDSGKYSYCLLVDNYEREEEENEWDEESYLEWKKKHDAEDAALSKWEKENLDAEVYFTREKLAY